MNVRVPIIIVAALLMGGSPLWARAQTVPLPLPPGTPVHVVDLNPDDLKRALGDGSVIYAVRDKSELPPSNPIAVYVPAGTDPAYPDAYVKINADDAGLLDPTKPMSKEAKRALLIAAILDVMASGHAGPNFALWYTIDAQVDADWTKGGEVSYAARNMHAGAWADSLMASGFVLDTGSFGQLGGDVRTLFVATSRELAPGVPGIAPVLKPGKALPSWDPLVHYLGVGGDPKIAGTDAIMYVNKSYLAGRALTAVPEVMKAYLMGFLMGTADLGAAGPVWKARYERMKAADVALPSTVSDRMANRRSMFAPLADQLEAQLHAVPAASPTP